MGESRMVASNQRVFISFAPLIGAPRKTFTKLLKKEREAHPVSLRVERLVDTVSGFVYLYLPNSFDDFLD